MSATLLTGPVAQALGWALLHLLWQATLAGAILAGVLALMSGRSANARYVASCTALGLVFAMFVGTAVGSYDPQAPAIEPAPAAAEEVSSIPLTHLPVIIAEGAAIGLRDRAVAALSSARNAFPTIVAIWLAGVVLLSARLLASWIGARRLVRGAAEPPQRQWQHLAARLAGALGLRRAVRLLQSSAVEVPSVVGWLRPVILLPASALSGMTPEQIEMVLAHELAHIRRHDFFVNLLQAIAETLMFYHPAVWWMSRRVRIERENCCDDLAVAVCGNAIQYARALTRLEELRATPATVLVAANGGSLVARIRRLARGGEEGPATASRWAAAVTMLVVLAVAAVVPSVPALAQREEKPAETTVEVVAPEAPLPPEPAPPAVAMSLDLEAISEVAAEAIAQPGVDVDVDVDTASAADFEYEHEYEYESEYDHDPTPPAIPAPPALAGIAGIAPPAVPAVTPRPALAPLAPSPRQPRAAIAPTPLPPGHRHAEEDEGEDIGAGGKLSVDELIALRAAGVTPAYVSSMRAIFQPLSVRSLASLSVLGVTPEYVKEMRAAGLEVKRPRDVTSLKAVGITREWLESMSGAGVKITTAREAARLRASRVTAEFVRGLAAAGYSNLSTDELANLAAAGVDEVFIRDLQQYRRKD